MPRPPVYPAHSRAILVTSAPPLHLLRNCHPSGLPALCVYASKALVRLICASLVNPFVSNTCALFFSLAALFHTRSLCFQWFADSFAKYPGVGVIQTVLEHHSGALTMGFYGEARLGDGSKRE